MSILFLSWRNFSRNLSRYRILLLALSLVILVFLLVVGLVGGVTESIRTKASRYFSGDVIIQEFDRSLISNIRNPTQILSIIHSLNISNSNLSIRSVYYQSDAQLFFDGISLGQRRLTGVEWQLEEDILSGFDFYQGQLPNHQDHQAMLISTATANHLGVRVGDELVITLRTRTGQINSGLFIVSGIFHESSFFGYTSYLHRIALNRLMNIPDESVSEIGIYLGNRNATSRVSQELFTRLSEIQDTFPIFLTRAQRDRELHPRWEGTRFALSTLDSLLAEIKDLLDALTLLAFLIIFLFGIMVFIGVANTYSLLVFERTVEIGTLRALGMTKDRVIKLFLYESLWLGVSGTILGLILGVLSLELLTRTLTISGSGWASLFLTQGRLIYSLSFSSVLGAVVVAILSSSGGALKSAVRASQLHPVEALRQE